MLNASCDFWLDMGVDGLRLDAVPYLCEREGTNCENLPETHAVIREIRARRWTTATRTACCWPRPTSGPRTRPPTSATATSATWPSTSRSCRASSWRCGMEDRKPDHRHPRADAGDPGQLPVGHLPAQPRRAHPGDGHRRGARLHVPRLRPRPADAHQRRHPPAAGAAGRTTRRRRIELLNSLLFSLPGTPILYYGDEIGMGDNIYLGDRNGVRTPMQWSGGPQRRLLAGRPGQRSTCR